ncbi:Sec-independent protein translocase protein TatB [Gemmobacter denitrificans]|uniref:Sec-independent protein translocase protein TatB n=1 Tax=Gemmobacter denitrificans TaxID=3123040 RepID=A0ABU8BRI1_9RHOB
MFDIGWSEMMVVGVVALVVIGPKDLPEMFRTLGRFTAKARGMAREFQRAMENAADEAGVKDVAKDLRDVTSARNMGLDAVKTAASKFEAWDPLKPKPAAPVAAAASAAPAAAAVTPEPAPPPAGPHTAALAAEVAERRAARAADAAARQAASDTPPVATPEPKDEA